MARPTLSLAKYLQQVGRGLRKVDGKETCVLIDNVGLYHIFGLPTAYRDWQAMFDVWQEKAMPTILAWQSVTVLYPFLQSRTTGLNL